MEAIHGYNIKSAWKGASCGETATAVKNGETYAIKRFRTYTKPVDDSSISKENFKERTEKFNKFVNQRKGINADLRSVSGVGGNIVFPTEEFVDGHFYYEVCPWILGAVPEENLKSVLAALPRDSLMLVLKTAVNALEQVHKVHIVHSDLKPQNILVVKKDDVPNKYIAKLIDFDSSYWVREKPLAFGGTSPYYAPEVGDYKRYEESEDEEDEKIKAALKAKINEKSDIFSLGVIFHEYLSGDFPAPRFPAGAEIPKALVRRMEKGKKVYCWEALNNGGTLEISPKIADPNLTALLRDMLDKDPVRRPNATQVLSRLKGEGDTLVVGYCEPWPEDNIELDIPRLKRSGFVGVARHTNAGMRGYRLCRKSGYPVFQSASGMISKQFAREKKASAPAPKPTPKPNPKPTPERSSVSSAGGFEEPWPEDAIVFDPDFLRSRGYIGVKRGTLLDQHGYHLVDREGKTRFLNAGMLLHLRFARKK